MDQMDTGHYEAVLREAKFSCFSAGRFFRGIIFMAFALCHKASWLVAPWVNWVAIFFMCLSGCTLWKTLDGAIQSKTPYTNIVYICMLITLCNPFFTDWMQYIECQLYHPMALWFSSMSAYVLLANGDHITLKKWIASSILLILSAGLYQIALQFFVLISVTLSFFAMKNEVGVHQIKAPILKLILALSVYCSAAVTQLVIVFSMNTNRVQSKNLSEIIRQLAKAQIELWSMVPYTKNPLSILFLCVAMLLVINLIGRVAARNWTYADKIICLLITSLGLLGYYASLFLPLIISELWFPQRSMVGFWGILLLIAIAGVTAHDKESMSKLEQVIFILACVLLSSNLVSCIRFGTDLYRVNAIDGMRGELIVNTISDYERATGITIEGVAFHQDAGYTYTYPDIVSSYENNQAAWSASWNYCAILQNVSGRNFIQYDYPEEVYLQYYNKDQDWSEFDTDQIRFRDGIAYVVVY